MTKTTIFKKVISILLAMTIIAGFLPVGVIEVGAVTPSAKSLPDISSMSQVDAFIAIAKSQEGYVEGYNNDTIYGIFTGKNNQAWCGSFVAWCANKAGISESIIPQSLTSSVNPASSNSMIKWYDKKGQWYKTRGGSWDNEIYDQPEKSVDYAPKSGDLILFETDNAFGNGPDHIGIFWKNENGKIYTIEGNTGTNKNSVKIKEYENDNTIWGYCHPNWSDGGSSSTPTVPTLGDPVSVGDNFYAYIRGVDNKNLTIDGASTPNVILTPSSNKKQDGKEIWYFKKGGDGYYYIKNVATGGYLDVYTGKPGPNLNVVLWGTERDENDAATHWYIHKHNGKYVLRAQCSYSDVVLDIHRDWGDGDMAGTYEFHGEANQLFTINKIDLSTYKPQNVTVSYNKTDASATVSWTANEKVDSQVSYYDIQIIRVSDNKVVKSKKNLTSRSYTFAELEDGEYYAKVIGRNKADPSNLKGIKDSSHFTAKRTVINVEKPTFTVFQKDKAYTAKFVTIASETSGSTIYYTTDGSSPSTTSKKLKNGGTIKISSNCTVKAIAVKSGFKSGTVSRYVYAGMKFGDADGNGKVNDDDTAMFVYDKFCIYNADVNGDGKANLTDFSNLSSGEMPVKNAPTITHEKVTGGYKLTFETKAKASTLYYSTDGGNNYNTIKNGGSVTVKESCTVKAYSKIYGVKSSTASKKITITKKKVETPEMTVTSVYNGKQVKLTCKTSGATIYYTTDGSKPTSSSKKYTGVFSVKASQTIKAIAIKSGMTNSSVISKSITVNKLNAPTADISSGSTVEKGTYLYLSANSGSTIYYTTDGSNPTTSSIKYTGKIKIEKDITIKAIAVRKGYLNSDIKTFEYSTKEEDDMDSNLHDWGGIKDFVSFEFDAYLCNYLLMGNNPKIGSAGRHSIPFCIGLEGNDSITLHYSIYVKNHSTSSTMETITFFVYVPSQAENLNLILSDSEYIGNYKFNGMNYDKYKCTYYVNLEIGEDTYLDLEYDLQNGDIANIIVELSEAGFIKNNSTIYSGVYVGQGEFFYLGETSIVSGTDTLITYDSELTASSAITAEIIFWLKLGTGYAPMPNMDSTPIHISFN